ncbi:phosphorylase family protein [Piscinibacter terrae]|uniref:Response regulator n=1 Tax=Piscinibacter terrae TaxID=2496871 RepID=A0A3N7HSK6_9BURK|nr:response regulator [Albitalea terrae]RQP24226.1 response regulator [Albitalea terrae]
MRVLIVDDEYSKVQAIAAALRAVPEIFDLNIVHETTAQAARATLRRDAIDLLVIDLHLPDVIGEQGSAEGGLALLSMMCLDDKVQLPTDVIFLSGREELLENATSKVAALGAMIYQYRADLTLWKCALVGRAKYICHRKKRTRDLPRNVDIAIVTALRSPELDAVLNLPYKWRQERLSGDPTPYYFGTIERGSDRAPLTVVATCATRKGMPSAGALAARVSTLFSPKYLVMTGICAGLAGKAALGDIIVADPTWDCGSGKQAEDVYGSPVFKAAPYQRQLDVNVMHIASELAKEPTIVQSIRAGWSERVPAGTLTVRVGPMASSASVVAASEFAASIAGQHKDLLAIEMEGYAVMAAAEYARVPAPISIVIKSVCDFADAKKDDDWQTYAAYTSAAFADHLFRHVAFAG